MSRPYCKGLTKQQLEEMGIVDVTWNKYLETWVITREWYKNNSKTKRERKTLIVGSVLARHKYTKDKTYLKVSFSYKNKPVAISLSRLVYAWFREDIPDGYVIDHKNNNPYDNTLDNLQMLTIEQNIRKRFDDLDCKCFNQYYNTGR